MRKFTSLDELPTAEQVKKELNRRRYRQQFAATLKNTFVSVMEAAAALILISWLLLPAVRVTGTSMEPTLSGNQIVLCNKLKTAKRKKHKRPYELLYFLRLFVVSFKSHMDFQEITVKWFVLLEQTAYIIKAVLEIRTVV